MIFLQQDARQQLENLGLPLTIEPHDCHTESLLSNSNSNISLRGMVNLLLLLLISYHLRSVIESLMLNNLVLKDSVSPDAIKIRILCSSIIPQGIILAS